MYVAILTVYVVGVIFGLAAGVILGAFIARNVERSNRNAELQNS